jgi:hypothetical protein
MQPQEHDLMQVLVETGSLQAGRASVEFDSERQSVNRSGNARRIKERDFMVFCRCCGTEGRFWGWGGWQVEVGRCYPVSFLVMIEEREVFLTLEELRLGDVVYKVLCWL